MIHKALGGLLESLDVGDVWTSWNWNQYRIMKWARLTYYCVLQEFDENKGDIMWGNKWEMEREIFSIQFNNLIESKSNMIQLPYSIFVLCMRSFQLRTTWKRNHSPKPHIPIIVPQQFFCYPQNYKRSWTAINIQEQESLLHWQCSITFGNFWNLNICSFLEELWA